MTPCVNSEVEGCTHRRAHSSPQHVDAIDLVMEATRRVAAVHQQNRHQPDYPHSWLLLRIAKE